MEPIELVCSDSENWDLSLAECAKGVGASAVLSQYRAPAHAGLASIAIVHDILFEDFPDLFSVDQIAAFSRLRESLRVATDVIAVSEYTAQRLQVHGYLRSGQRLHVVYAGHDHMLGASREGCSHRDHLFADPYAIYIGRLTDRKNISVLVEATQDAAWPKATPLVVVGGVDGVSRCTEVALARLESTGRGRWLGEVDDRCARTLISNASCLAYPSPDEGFGLPVLEARALGTRSVCMPIPVVSEIAGIDAMVLGNPADPHELAMGVSALHEHHSVHPSDSPSETTNRRHWTKLTWASTGRQVAAIVRSAALASDSDLEAAGAGSAETSAP